MKLKKLPWYLLIFLLTLGACLTLGFLSFGGAYVVFPIIAFAVTGFALSVLYEAEIYFQNIRGALKKLLDFDYYEKLIANEILRLYLVDILKYRNEAPPQFFVDYEKQLHLAHKTGDDLERKKLKAMEEWFALQLFSKAPPASAWQQELQDYIKNDPFMGNPRDKLAKRKWLFRFVAFFSLVSGIFMGLGTTYLVMESLAVFHIAFLTLSIPGAVIPLFTLIFLASVAYSLLIYHAVTDMINNETLKSWFFSLRDNLRMGLSFRNVFLALLSMTLVVLAVTLTVCTAGTWWTIAKEARPFFVFMAGKAKQAIDIIMGVINPIFMFGSTLAFNLENIKQTYDIIDEATRLEPEQSWSEKLKLAWQKYSDALDKEEKKRIKKENGLQRANPFAWLIRYVPVPFRLIGFALHIYFIGVTADKMPGMSEDLSGGLGAASEAFEDAHWFMDHSHDKLINPTTRQLLDARFGGEASHNHDADIPTRILKLTLFPLYLGAILWDWGFSKLNSGERKPLSFGQAFAKHTGWSETAIPTRMIKIACLPFYALYSLGDWLYNARKEHSLPDVFLKHLAWGNAKGKHKKHDCHHHHHETESFIPKPEDKPSSQFALSHLIYKIEKHQRLHFMDEDDKLAKKKTRLLKDLASGLKKIRAQKEPSLEAAHALIKKAKGNTILARQRYSFFAPDETATITLLDQLEKQIAVAA